ncbi:hypothetical protein DH2020_010060 [Rehmannia glutinosa]|uniref:Trichome birefringence-like N-terminal domain-containing protein n=1 Tax=Rehmannia glutinosa TaxID=99300 RepID=A0ABR0X822_REHGL
MKEWPKTAYPKALVSIVASVGGLALFLLLASTFLREIEFNCFFTGHRNEVISQNVGTKSVESGEGDGKVTVIENNRSPESQDKNETSDSGQVKSENSKDKFPRSTVTQEEDGNRSSSPNDAGLRKSDSFSSNNLPTDITETVESSAATTNLSRANVVDSDCDLYHGKWIYDSTGPLYTNNSCPVLTQMQNCQGNGRPDKDYENWRWKPSQCDLPRFDPKKFLELMRGKTLAFIGDSVARNQMESMLCILWQVEAPKNRGNRKMQRYYFRSTSTMIVRIWSSWLVRQTSEPFDFAPAGVVKLHLDAPDDGFMEYITGFDVIVLSSATGLPNSRYHYEGGAWNTGGSCTGKEKPAEEGELAKMDAFSYRHDGHPGPYRSPDPNKITKRGPDGRPPPQDCLHWCMPGPVDTWNELVFEIIRREFHDGQNSSR